MSEIYWVDLFLPIFIGMGPVKVLLVYMALTNGSSKTLQRKVAQKAVLTATFVAILLLLIGPLLMKLLHFTPGALTIAGGLILLLLALSMVLSPADKTEKAGPLSEASFRLRSSPPRHRGCSR